MPIKVEIVTLDRRLISDEVDMVTLPGASGQMGILHGHAPLLSTLDIGEIILHKGTETRYIAVGGGVAEIRPEKVTVLAETRNMPKRSTRRALQLRSPRPPITDRQPPRRAQSHDRGGVSPQCLAFTGRAASPRTVAFAGAFVRRVALACGRT